MSTRNIIFTVLAAVIIIGAVVITIVGVVTHHELTFDGSLDPFPQEAIPLGVTCSGDRCQVIEQMVRAFNGRVGFRLFIWGSSEPRIFFYVGVPRNVGTDWTGDGQDDEGNLYHQGENFALSSGGGHAYRCDVRTSNTGDDPTLFVVAYHGLGHCVGLGHDPTDYSISVMREVQPDNIADLGPAYMPSLTDSDREALRDRYR